MKSIAFAMMSIALVACAVKESEPSAPSPEGAPGSVVDARDPMAPAPRPRPGMAMLRAVHASANAPAVDVYVKGNPAAIVSGLAYGQTSGWLEVPKGSYTFELRAAPSRPRDPVVHVTGALAVDDGAMISAIAAGLVATTDTDASFRVLPIVEAFDAVPGGQALVRVVHAGADAPSVDLDLGDVTPRLVRFASTPPAAVPAGIELPIGVANDGARVTSFTTPKLPAGAAVLVVATGLLAEPAREDDGFALLAIGPNGSVGFIKQDPTVYALHASPDAPTVDGFAGASEIFANLSFGQISEPIRVAPGDYAIDLFGAAPGTGRPEAKPAASGRLPQLVAGESYLVAATGPLAALKLVTAPERFRRDDTNAVLAAVHASADAPAVDIRLLGDDHTLARALFPDLAYTEVSDTVAAAPGALSLGVAPARTSSPVATLSVPARAGARAFVVAAGSLAPAAGQKSFRLLVTDTARTPWTVTSVFPH